MPEEASGTAFRIGPHHLLINHHVLFDHERGDRKADDDSVELLRSAVAIEYHAAYLDPD